MRIADPMDALVSRQRKVGRRIRTNPIELSPGFRFVLDQPNGVVRYTYALIEHGRVKSIAIFVHH